MINVNLLPSQNVLSQKEKDLRRKLKIGLTISSSLLAVVVLFLIIFDGFLSLRLNQQKQKSQEFLTQFQGQMSVALDLRKLKDKISGIKTVQAGQTDFTTMAASVSALLTSGINLKTMSLDKNGKVNLTASAEDLASLQVFLPAIKGTLSGLRLTKNNSFEFSLEMTYGAKKT